MVHTSGNNKNKKAQHSLVDQMLATLETDDAHAVVESPHHHDVLCGRGGLTNHHSGNISFRKLVDMNKGLYSTSPKSHKIIVSLSIVESIGGQQPPGRFLQRDPKTGLWHDIGKKKAIQKTSQALREGGVESVSTDKPSSRKRARESERKNGIRWIPFAIDESTPTQLVNIKKHSFATSAKKLKKVASQEITATVSDDECSVNSRTGSPLTASRNSAYPPVTPSFIAPSPPPSYQAKEGEADVLPTSNRDSNDTQCRTLPSHVVDTLMGMVENENSQEKEYDVRHTNFDDIMPIDISEDLCGERNETSGHAIDEDRILLEGISCFLTC